MEQILFIGDVHIKFNNLKEIEILENKILDLKENITFIVIAGDVLDTHEKINTQLLNKAYNFIKICRRKAPVYVLVGNHDYINNQQFLTSNHWMNGLKEWNNIYIVDKPIYYNEGKYLFMPYVPVGRFIEALSPSNVVLEEGRQPTQPIVDVTDANVEFYKPKSVDIQFDWKKCICIFAHQEMKNCKMGPIQSIEGDEWNLEWPMLISGHIHERQFVQKNVLYPGSVINHSFGSDNQGLSLISFLPYGQDSSSGPDRDNKNYKLIEIKIDIGLEKKSIIYEQLNSKSLVKLDQMTKNITKNNKLSLEGEMKDIAAFKKTKTYKTLVDKQIKIVFRVKSNNDNNNETKPAQQASLTPFSNILTSLIVKETDNELKKDFQIIKEQK